jgi:hypothetical protein
MSAFQAGSPAQELTLVQPQTDTGWLACIRLDMCHHVCGTAALAGSAS